ncbi:carbon-phosphorus lyase [bacterium]|nr:carbon-phosphorus lyase [bacterium]
MRIQILGTAAAEGWPGIFCGCTTCAKARALGGKNLRSRASLQIDDIFKIDLPPDTYYHSIRFGIDQSKLKHLFYTHSHGDHFDPDEVEYMSHPFAHCLANAPIQIYGNEKVMRAIKSRHERRELPAEFHTVEPYIPIKADYLTFIPILAEHARNETALNYIIQSETATVLYSSDTGFYGKSTLDFISNFKFDLLIAECTNGTALHSSQLHMNMRDVLKLRTHLTRAGAVSPATRTVITHFSHNIGLLHEELESKAAKKDIEVAYDGIILEV